MNCKRYHVSVICVLAQLGRRVFQYRAHRLTDLRPGLSTSVTRGAIIEFSSCSPTPSTPYPFTKWYRTSIIIIHHFFADKSFLNPECGTSSPSCLVFYGHVWTCMFFFSPVRRLTLLYGILWSCMVVYYFVLNLL